MLFNTNWRTFFNLSLSLNRYAHAVSAYTNLNLIIPYLVAYRLFYMCTCEMDVLNKIKHLIIAGDGKEFDISALDLRTTEPHHGSRTHHRLQSFNFIRSERSKIGIDGSNFRCKVSIYPSLISRISSYTSLVIGSSHFPTMAAQLGLDQVPDSFLRLSQFNLVVCFTVLFQYTL